jgi:multicomponent Na+:H+ antiporter subunit E
MSPERTAASQSRNRAFVLRWTGYFVFWVLLIGFKPVDLVVGLFAATVATWVSLKLLQPGALNMRAVDLLRYSSHFFWQSVLAGIDVARRAFSPRMRLQPGFVRYSCRYPRGPARNAFAVLSSLMPGTVVVEDTADSLLFHCVDTGQPVATQMAREEAELFRLLPKESSS